MRGELRDRRDLPGGLWCWPYQGWSVLYSISRVVLGAGIRGSRRLGWWKGGMGGGVGLDGGGDA